MLVRMISEYLYLFRKSFNFIRLINLIKISISYYLSILIKKSVVWGFPPIVMIEPTNICNLKCPMCPSGNGSLKREKGYMDFPLFQKIIDEIAKKSFQVVLWNQGEPFLNEDFLKMSKYASDKGLITLVSTNGNYLPDAHELVKAGIDILVVSLDGATQETYNKYRVNGDLEKVLENVEKIVKAKKENKSHTPYVKWQFIVMKHNEQEIDKIKNLARKLEVDKLQLKSVQIYSKEDVRNFLPENPKLRRYKIKGDDFELKFGIKNRCRRLWSQPVVNWNGEIAVCCFDKDIKHNMGNIKKTSLQEIWKNQAFQQIRNEILTDRKQHEMCTNCGEGIKLKIKETNVKLK